VVEMNAMREIKIEKVTLNIGCGDDPAKIEKATKLLEALTERKPLVTKSRTRSTFGVAKGKPIGAMVTLRGKKAEEFLKQALQALENKIKNSQFDSEGNFSFGIASYIDIPGVKYQHTIGMLGLNVIVTLERAGYRIKRRKIQQRKIPSKQIIKKEEVISWLKEKFGVETI
jgi:large subunit ribosomal protein L5